MALEQDKIDEKKKKNRDRFVKIIENRVNRILDNLESLGRCSNRRNYEYTDEDVRKIFREIENKTRDIKSMFQGGSKNKKIFKL